MYNKTIWNPGDIITQEKWDNLNNNLSILGAYQLPVTIEAEALPKKSGDFQYNITIHKSYNEIIKLLTQGIICWYYNNLNGGINYITSFNHYYKTLNNSEFSSNDNEMINYLR